MIAISLFFLYIPIYFGITYFLVSKRILSRNWQEDLVQDLKAIKNKRFVSKNFIKDRYSFGKDEKEVLKFIASNREVVYLLNKLPAIVEQFYGTGKIPIGFFSDYEDPTWQNISVDMPKNKLTLDEQFEIQKEIFKILETDKRAVAALYHVTISL